MLKVTVATRDSHRHNTRLFPGDSTPIPRINIPNMAHQGVENRVPVSGKLPGPHRRDAAVRGFLLAVAGLHGLSFELGRICPEAAGL